MTLLLPLTGTKLCSQPSGERGVSTGLNITVGLPQLAISFCNTLGKRLRMKARTPSSSCTSAAALRSSWSVRTSVWPVNSTSFA